MNEEKDQRAGLSSKADAAFRLAAKKVIQRARQTGTPVVVWEQGHVKEIPGEQFEITTAARHDMASHPFNGLLSK